jgi:hypothetical protein
MRYPITKFLEGHGQWRYVNAVLNAVYVPCGCVWCDPGCTHWRIVINAWETLTVAAADGVRCARVRWEINFLLTFETAPFFCVHPVCSWAIVRTPTYRTIRPNGVGPTSVSTELPPDGDTTVYKHLHFLVNITEIESDVFLILPTWQPSVWIVPSFVDTMRS